MKKTLFFFFLISLLSFSKTYSQTQSGNNSSYVSTSTLWASSNQSSPTISYGIGSLLLPREYRVSHVIWRISTPEEFIETTSNSTFITNSFGGQIGISIEAEIHLEDFVNNIPEVGVLNFSLSGSFWTAHN
jgi:hypothetical protein